MLFTRHGEGKKSEAVATVVLYHPQEEFYRVVLFVRAYIPSLLARAKNSIIFGRTTVEPPNKGHFGG